MAYEREAALDPEYVKGWWGKGAILYRLHRYQEALAAYDLALVLDPNNAVLLNSKALTLRALGQAAEAQEAQRRAQELGG